MKIEEQHIAMRNRYTRTLLYCATLIAAALMSCTDDLSLLNSGSQEEADGITFTLGVTEQADLLYQLGQQTRAAGQTPDPAIVSANTFGEHTFDGALSDLRVHRMVLPLVGIHPHTASGSPLNSSSSPFSPSSSPLTPSRLRACDTIAGAPSTRARVEDIVSDALTFHDSLSIWGYTKVTPPVTLINGNLLTKINGWRSHIQWPYIDGLSDEDKATYVMRFYAIAPALDCFETLKLTNTPAFGTKPNFSFDIPSDIAAQRDLLYGESTPDLSTSDWGDVNISNGPDGSTTSDPRTENLGYDNKKVRMQFQHILTAVRFAQGKMPVDATIKEIKLEGIKYKGTNFNPAGPTWTVAEDVTSYTLPVSKSISYYDTTAPSASSDPDYSGGNIYIDGGNVMFLMPHTLGSEAKLQVKLEDVGGTEHTVKCNLTGDTWSPGYTVTYKITVGELQGEYYLVIDPSANYSTSGTVTTPVDGNTTTETKYSHASDSYEPGESMTTIGIHSFRNYKDYSTSDAGTNRHQAVNWQVAGFSTTEDGTYTNADDDFTSITGWSISAHEPEAVAGSTTTLAYAFKAPVDYSYNHQTTLDDNNATTMNLSTHLPDGTTTEGVAMPGYSSGAIYNSANCYIINAEGTYQFPLVYGNSYQNGSPIDLSSNTLFVDHLGNAIHSANILAQVNPTSYSETDATSEITTEEEAESITKKSKFTRDTYGVREATDITCGIVWQDATGVFGTPNFSTQPTTSTIGFINFTVSSSIKPSNCVMALYGAKSVETVERVYKNDGSSGYIEYEGTINGKTYPYTSYTTPDAAEVLWTWHIWVTDEVYPNRDAVTDSHYPQYNSSTLSKIATIYDTDGTTPLGRILPVNLGWVPDEMAWHRYEPRNVWVKITQVGSDQVAYVNLRREAKQDLITGTSTVYQWGRPTALPMVNLISGTTRTIYSGTSSDITSSFAIADPGSGYVANAIKQPTQIIKATTKNWWSGTDNNLFWNTTKTLYDPCPPGFQAPAKSLFEFLVYTSPVADNTEYTTLNMWPGSYGSNKGGYFYTTKRTSAPSSAERYGPMIYLPASGYYSGNATAGTAMTGQQKDKSIGYLWTTDHATHEEGSSIYFGTDGKVKFVTEENNDLRPVRGKAQ